MEAALRVVEVPGRGLGTVATRDLRAGEVVLIDPPLLVYSVDWATTDFCSYCLKALGRSSESFYPCSMCGQARFCNQACQAAATADPASHCPLVCKTLSCCNMSGLADEDQKGSIHFLVRAASLFLHSMQNGGGSGSSEERARCLMSLASPIDDSHESITVVCKELHGRVEKALQTAGIPPDQLNTVFSLQVAVRLLGIEARNAYGIPAPVTGAFDDRNIRGTAICYQSSRINHECLPNVARCDDFDQVMSMRFAMLHDLPAGEEITQSYFPLGLHFVERQLRLREQYGFICTCPRCVEEAHWDGTATSDEPEHLRAAHHNLQVTVKEASPSSGASEDMEAYIHVFLTKYVCPNPNECGGTMVPEDGVGEEEVLWCCMCGWKQTQAEFLAALES